MKPCGIHRGRCLAGVALLAVLRLGACEVLSIQTSPPQDLEAVVANWNVGLDDAGAPPFAGHLRFSGAFCEGGRVDVRGTLALIDSAACDDLVQTTHRLAEAGAIGVIFFYHEHGLGGLALGDAAPPTIRAVLIERDPGLEVAKLLTLNQAAIFAELKPGKLISEDAYEEQFIFRVDEFLATRKENFLWHRYPSLLRSTGRETLSARLMPHLQMPKGWFSRPMGFVPLFNPSLLSLSDGTFLVALRMSNGQGCPSVRAARESSMDTRVCRNELVLAHLAKDFSVQSHVLVEMPKLSCYFTSETQTAGRQFLDEVHGPMDARIAWGADEIWVLFYAERNRDQEVERGMHAAPLHISWEKCSGWVMHSNDAVFAPSQCQWLGTGHAPHTLSNCQASCDAKENCDTFSFREGAACELRHCLSTEPEVWRIDGWQSWRRGAPKCLQHAWVKEEELLVFPAAAVEKNWNLIEGRRDRLFLEYFIEPHIVLTAHLHRHDAGLTMTALEQSFVARWPYEVLHGLTNVRGGFCCLRLPQELLEAHQLFAEPWWSAEEGEDVPAIPKGALRLGAGHLQRIRSPFDQAPGDLSRFRRQAKSRTYHQFFYLVRDSEPFDVVAVSPEWCITINGHFSQHWAEVLSPGEEACESIQFVAGLALRSNTSGSEVVVSYGINDCESDLLPLAVSQVLAMLRPVTSDVNASLDDLEMI